MRSATLAFLLGLTALLWLPVLPGKSWTGLLAAAVLAAALLQGVWRRQMRLIVMTGAGLLWGLGHAQDALEQLLPRELEGRDLVVEGRIDSLPDVNAARIRFEFAIDDPPIGEGRAAWRGRVRLAWYGRKDPPAVGERWRFTVRLARPHGVANPGGFDYEAWLLQAGVRATGHVRGEGERLALATGYPVDRLRERLKGAIRDALPDNPLAPVVVALAIGDQSGVTPGQWTLFGRTGITHLISISGLHVGMVAAVAWGAAAWLWRRSARLGQRLPAPKAGALAGAAAAFGYALLAGFSVPTQRTAVMVAVGAAALWSQREPEPSRVLALALLAVLLHDPFAIFAPGLWLSFGAVVAIFYGLSGRVGAPALFKGWGRTQWVVTLGMLPITIALFTRDPLLSPLANLFAVPWIELLVVPLTLLGTALAPLWPAAGEWPLLLAAGALGVAMELLGRLAALPIGYLVLAPPAWALAVALPGLLLLLAPRGFPARSVGGLWLLPMLTVGQPRPEPGAIELTLLDVGQGLSAAIRTARHTLVFDTGPALGELDAGRTVVAPFLRAKGIGGLDLLVLSHSDLDHVGGARSLLAEIPVAATVAGEAVPGVGAGRCRRGQRWEWDGVQFEFLHPGDGPQPPKTNDRSCVLKVSGRGGALLLPGDLEASGEEGLLALGGEGLAATVVVAGHHGSRTSSSRPWVAAVHPRYALYAVGHRNRWNFPSGEVEKRYRDVGAAGLRTDESGAITVTLAPGREPRVDLERRDRARWWRASVGE